MNTGVCDAHNLAWKLAAVLQGRAGPGLLDTYTREPLLRWQRRCSAAGAGSCAAPPCYYSSQGCLDLTSPAASLVPAANHAAERKPVGYANCMLSVANFNEALRVPQVGGRGGSRSLSFAAH